MAQNPSGPADPQLPRPSGGPTLTLVGRGAEVALVRDLIDRAGAVGGALIVRGEPGIGKSALLRTAINFALERGHLLLTSSGTPAEQHLPFAALHHLLGPALAASAPLASPHRAALDRVFGFTAADSPPPPPFVVALAALELLAEYASDGPLTVAVDDLQWMDEASQDVLLFVARRVRTERIAMVLATREPETTTGVDPIADELPLQPLDDGAARRLLVAAHPTLSGAAFDRTLRMAAGNPLALLELPRAVDATNLDEAVPLPLPLPWSARSPATSNA